MSLHYESMSNMEIRKVLSTDKDCKIYFRGVFAADTLPKKVCVPCTLVVNTDVAGKPGQHWVAIFITKKRQGFYFDSYGLPPSVPFHIAFIRRNCTSWVFNSKLLQSFTTFVCGHYACLFVLAASTNFVKMFLNMYDSGDTYSNDAKALLQFRKRFLTKGHNCIVKSNNHKNCMYQKSCAKHGNVKCNF